MFIESGSIIQNTSITSTDESPVTTGDGCIFVNVIFTNPVYFGVGNIFQNCTFIDAKTKFNTLPYITGNANVFESCVSNYVHFGENNISDKMNQGARPNIIGVNMQLSNRRLSYEPIQISNSCFLCGNFLATHNGRIQTNSALVTPNEEHKSADANSSGVCC